MGSGLSGICAEVQENEIVRSVSSRILWVKLQFVRVKVRVVLVHILTEDDHDDEERKRFWSD